MCKPPPPPPHLHGSAYVSTLLEYCAEEDEILSGKIEKLQEGWCAPPPLPYQAYLS